MNCSNNKLQLLDRALGALDRLAAPIRLLFLEVVAHQIQKLLQDLEVVSSRLVTRASRRSPRHTQTQQISERSLRANLHWHLTWPEIDLRVLRNGVASGSGIQNAEIKVRRKVIPHGGQDLAQGHRRVASALSGVDRVDATLAQLPDVGHHGVEVRKLQEGKDQEHVHAQNLLQLATDH